MSQVREIIVADIKDHGAITFERFMELALYCPNYGYYERETDIIGRRGDFYTSVSVGSLFGELLGLQFAEWLQATDGQAPDSNPAEQGGPVRIVEAGAHGGDLARDILEWMRLHRPALFCRLEYWIVEPSKARQGWQQRTLSDFGNAVRWIGDVADLPSTGSRTIIFSNEFLDALPLRRLGWDAKARSWFEWGVTLEAERLVWTRINVPAPAAAPQQGGTHSSITHPFLPVDGRLLEVLPDGFTMELCPAAEQWWGTAATALERGKLLTIDYGLRAEEVFAPERKHGTLRAYHRHQPSSDVLAAPGEQDITAHVQLDAIRTVGETAGLVTDGVFTQAQFLTAIAARAWSPEGLFGEWTPERTRQFQTLVHPSHLGQSFRVLVQSRK